MLAASADARASCVLGTVDFKSNVTPLNLPQREVVLLPLTNEHHWGLLVFRRSDESWLYYDSVRRCFGYQKRTFMFCGPKACQLAD